jgi:hypothetical protein
MYSGVDYFSNVPMFQNMVINKNLAKLYSSYVLRNPTYIFSSHILAFGNAKMMVGI